MQFKKKIQLKIELNIKYVIQINIIYMWSNLAFVLWSYVYSTMLHEMIKT